MPITGGAARPRELTVFVNSLCMGSGEGEDGFFPFRGWVEGGGGGGGGEGTGQKLPLYYASFVRNA